MFVTALAEIDKPIDQWTRDDHAKFARDLRREGGICSREVRKAGERNNIYLDFGRGDLRRAMYLFERRKEGMKGLASWIIETMGSSREHLEKSPREGGLKIPYKRVSRRDRLFREELRREGIEIEALTA